MTTSSAGQPPRQADALQPPQALVDERLGEQVELVLPVVEPTWPPSMWAKYRSVSNR